MAKSILNYPSLPEVAIAHLATTPDPGVNTIAWSTTENAPIFWSTVDAVWRLLDPWKRVYLNSDFSVTTTTTTDVTGLSFAVPTNRLVEVRARLMVMADTDAANGVRPGVRVPTNLVRAAVTVRVSNSTSAITVRNSGAVNTTVVPAAAASLTAGTAGLATVDALLQTDGNAPGANFFITLNGELATSQVTMRAGSFLEYNVRKVV